MFHGTAHIVLGSGLTVAGAVACLGFTRLPYFQSLGIPAALGILVALVGALTLGPAILTLGALWRLRTQARDANPRLAADRYGHCPLARPRSCVAWRVALVGLLALPGYKTELRHPALHARQRAGQCRVHGSRAALFPRPAGARTSDGRGRIMTCATRPTCWSWTGWPKPCFMCPASRRCRPSPGLLGTPLVHSSLAFAVSNSSAAHRKTCRINGIVPTTCKGRQGNWRRRSTSEAAVHAAAAARRGHPQRGAFTARSPTIKEVRDKIANFDDFFRPIRSYFYWEPHCYDIPVCFACGRLRRARQHRQLTQKFEDLTATLDKLDALQPKLVALYRPRSTARRSIRTTL